MTGIEKQFADELEIFRTEAEGGAQLFYSYLGVHELAKRDPRVIRMLNQNALFWNTVLVGLQTGAMMTLARIFDRNSPHNLGILLRLASQNLNMFSKAALAARKQGSDHNPPTWLPQYLRTAYEPSKTDFRRLGDLAKKYRRIYQDKYHDLRNQFYAHKQAADPVAVTALFAKTNIREMQRLFVFLLKLRLALYQLYENGHRPVLRPFRYSAQRIGRLPSTAIAGDSVHERITVQAEQALLGLLDRQQ